MERFRNTVRPLLNGHPRDFDLKSCRLIEFSRLKEVQYRFERKGSKHGFIASI